MLRGAVVSLLVANEGIAGTGEVAFALPPVGVLGVSVLPTAGTAICRNHDHRTDRDNRISGAICWV